MTNYHDEIYRAAVNHDWLRLKEILYKKNACIDEIKEASCYLTAGARLAKEGFIMQAINLHERYGADVSPLAMGAAMDGNENFLEDLFQSYHPDPYFLALGYAWAGNEKRINTSYHIKLKKHKNAILEGAIWGEHWNIVAKLCETTKPTNPWNFNNWQNLKDDNLRIILLQVAALKGDKKAVAWNTTPEKEHAVLLSVAAGGNTKYIEALINKKLLSPNKPIAIYPFKTALSSQKGSLETEKKLLKRANKRIHLSLPTYRPSPIGFGHAGLDGAIMPNLYDISEKAFMFRPPIKRQHSIEHCPTHPTTLSEQNLSPVDYAGQGAASGGHWKLAEYYRAKGARIETITLGAMIGFHFSYISQLYHNASISQQKKIRFAINYYFGKFYTKSALKKDFERLTHALSFIDIHNENSDFLPALITTISLTTEKSFETKIHKNIMLLIKRARHIRGKLKVGVPYSVARNELKY